MSQPFQFNVKADIKSVEQSLGAMSKHVVPKAANATINKVGITVRATAKRNIARQLGVVQKVIKEKVILIKSNWKRLSAIVVGRSFSIPLIMMKGRKTQTKKGVRVQRKVRESSFFAPLKQGKAIAMRVGKSRLPIKQLYGGNVTREFLEQETIKAMDQDADRRFKAEWPRQVRYYLDRYWRSRK